jgi:hypothetical protein
LRLRATEEKSASCVGQRPLQIGALFFDVARTNHSAVERAAQLQWRELFLIFIDQTRARTGCFILKSSGWNEAKGSHLAAQN